MILEKEYEVYKVNREKLLIGNEGKFVSTKGMEIIDIYASYEDALKSGLKQFGNILFSTKRIEREEQVSFFMNTFSLSFNRTFRMKISYDTLVKAIYIELEKKKVAKTKEFAPEVFS